MPSDEVAIRSSLATILICSNRHFWQCNGHSGKSHLRRGNHCTTTVQTAVIAVSTLVPATASTTVSINSINDTIDIISNNNSCSNNSDNGSSAGLASISDSGQDDNGGNSNICNGYRWAGITRSPRESIVVS